MNVVKRTRAQLDSDRKRIAELALQGYSQRKIADIMEYETGRPFKQSKINSDLAIIRREWQKEMVTDYNYLMNQELQRCDQLENELWEAWKRSLGGTKREVVEKIAKMLEGSDEPDLVLNKITETIESNTMDTSILNQILSVQKERRRLLGLYAPTQLGINMYSEQVVRVKGYAPTASPDNWPSLEDGIVDGEFDDSEE
jgi:transcriptional regulator of heat shock response